MALSGLCVKDRFPEISAMTDQPRTPPSLSPIGFYSVLGLSLVVFLVVDDPLNKNPFDMDASILWSYLAIPVLVAIAYLIERKFHWLAALVSTIEVTALKFGITYALATILWMQAGPPPPRPVAEPQTYTKVPAPRVPTPNPNQALVAYNGIVSAKDGGPMSGASVYAAPAHHGQRYEPPANPVHVRHTAAGFTASTHVIQVGQKLRVSSEDGVLHTALAQTHKGQRIFNVAILASGEPRSVRFERGYGWVQLTCTAHRDKPLNLLVLDHPFWALSKSDGSFDLRAIPKARLRAWGPVHGDISNGIRLAKP
jgi:plastocyanin